MKSRLLACATFALSLIALPLLFHAQTPSSKSDPYLTAHEWGTFTSIAGKDGHALEWLPLTGSTDLPSFVEHFSGATLKAGLLGTVRMETPVLYFYTNRETTISVHVSFSKGLITEWYPRASQVYPVSAVAPKYASFSDWSLYQKHPDGSIAWDSVELKPRNFAEFPRENHANHYYAARQTASTPLQVKTLNGVQTEKFLFYRGVSTFAVPIFATIHSDGGLRAENLTDPAISEMLLFERRGDKMGFRIVQPSASNPTLDPPELNADMDSLRRVVVDMLIGQGLYQDEAQAMFETWSDSWFEEGSRLLYIVPRPFLDSILPLTINPVPAQTVRVFVGRMELVTPATQHAVEQALATHDDATLLRYNRFLAPILETMIANEKNSAKKAKLSEYLENAYNTQISANASNYTLLWGRKTYDFSIAMNPSSVKKSADSKSPRRTRDYVFSRTLKTIDDANVELVTSDAVEFVRALKQSPGKEICLMSGGDFAQSLLAANLVDEIRLNIHPILLGSGIPTFRDPGHRVKLSLTECRQIDGGCILASYKVLNTG